MTTAFQVPLRSRLEPAQLVVILPERPINARPLELLPLPARAVLGRECIERLARRAEGGLGGREGLLGGVEGLAGGGGV